MIDHEASTAVNNELNIPRVIGVSALGAGILNFGHGFEMPSSPEVGGVLVVAGGTILAIQKAVEIIRERRLARRIAP